MCVTDAFKRMIIETDPSPVIDTSSGTGFADMSAAVETEDEKE
jgi:hypothetical protein